MPSNWIAAENQFIWVARIVDDDSSDDPATEVVTPDEPHNPEQLLAVVPLSELTARVLQSYHDWKPRQKITMSSESARLDDFAEMTDLSIIFSYPTPESIRHHVWSGKGIADDWLVYFHQRQTFVVAEAEAARRIQPDLDQVADDWVTS